MQADVHLAARGAEPCWLMAASTFPTLPVGSSLNSPLGVGCEVEWDPNDCLHPLVA